MLLQLSDDEYEVVNDVLARAMRDLREEIYKTDATELKIQLKQRKALLADVLQRLNALPVT